MLPEEQSINLALLLGPSLTSHSPPTCHQEHPPSALEFLSALLPLPDSCGLDGGAWSSEGRLVQFAVPACPAPKV